MSASGVKYISPIESLNPKRQEAIPVPEAQMPTYPLTSPTRRL